MTAAFGLGAMSLATFCYLDVSFFVFVFGLLRHKACMIIEEK